MSQTVQAVFEDGLLRPLAEVSLRENQKVTLRIDEADPSTDDVEDIEFLEYCRAEGDPNISLEAVRKAMSKIHGNMTQACSEERDEE